MEIIFIFLQAKIPTIYIVGTLLIITTALSILLWKKKDVSTNTVKEAGK